MLKLESQSYLPTYLPSYLIKKQEYEYQLFRRLSDSGCQRVIKKSKQTENQWKLKAKEMENRLPSTVLKI